VLLRIILIKQSFVSSPKPRSHLNPHSAINESEPNLPMSQLDN